MRYQTSKRLMYIFSYLWMLDFKVCNMMILFIIFFPCILQCDFYQHLVTVTKKSLLLPVLRCNGLRDRTAVHTLELSHGTLCKRLMTRSKASKREAGTLLIKTHTETNIMLGVQFRFSCFGAIMRQLLTNSSIHLSLAFILHLQVTKITLQP